MHSAFKGYLLDFYTSYFVANDATAATRDLPEVSGRWAVGGGRGQQMLTSPKGEIEKIVPSALR